MQIISGRVKKPFNIIVFGVPGIGKSSFAAGWYDTEGVFHKGSPSPLFLGAEENDELETDRAPKATSFNHFTEQLDWLSGNKHSYQTIVIDTIDSIEKLLHKKILADDPKAKGSMGKAHGGFGKAFEIAEQEMTAVKEKLTVLRDRGLNIILLAHSKKVQSTDTILGLQHDTYEMTLHQRVQNVFVDWVSAVLFANYVTYFKEDVNTDKMFAVGEGERLLLTEKRPGHLGKNRYSMPYKIKLEFSEFEKNYEAFFENKIDPENLKASIMGAIELLSHEQSDVAAKVIQKVGEADDDVNELQKILNRVLELTGQK